VSEDKSECILALPSSTLCLLIVDGSAEIRRRVRELLEAARYRVLEAGDGADALTILALIRERVVVLIGAELPDMNSAAAPEAIRTSAVTREMGHVYLVMADAGAAQHGAVQAIDVPILSRPPQAPELYREVASAVVRMVAPAAGWHAGTSIHR
jgi:CheY-like chemotaxis protein